jgi:single-stranded DNA-binding protein
MNNLTITGYLASDATVSNFGDNTVINFTVICNEYINKEQSNVIPFQCAYWTKKDIASHLTKGLKVTVIGTIKENTIAKKDGQPVISKSGEPIINLKVNVSNIDFMSKKEATEPVINAPVAKANEANSVVPQSEDLPF